jgi:hypothetical protein
MPTTYPNQLVLNQGSSFSLRRNLIHAGASADILSSSVGINPVIQIGKTGCFAVNDKIFITHLAGDCDRGLFGCGKITAIVGDEIEIAMADASTINAPGDANGLIGKAQNVKGWIGILAVYSSLEPSPPSMEGSIDAGSHTLLIQCNPDDVRTGDKVWLPEAGIVGATAKSIRLAVKGAVTYTIVQLSQNATTSIEPSAAKSVRREGQLLAYAKLNPSGDGSCGLFEGFLDARDIANLPSSESCGCDPCLPVREVGCYSITYAYGAFNPPGRNYPLYTASYEFTAEVGRVMIQQSISPALAQLRA